MHCTDPQAMAVLPSVHGAADVNLACAPCAPVPVQVAGLCSHSVTPSLCARLLTSTMCRLPGSSSVHASAPVDDMTPQALHSAWASEACPTTISLHHCAVHQVRSRREGQAAVHAHVCVLANSHCYVKGTSACLERVCVGSAYCMHMSRTGGTRSGLMYCSRECTLYIHSSSQVFRVPCHDIWPWRSANHPAMQPEVV